MVLCETLFTTDRFRPVRVIGFKTLMTHGRNIIGPVCHNYNRLVRRFRDLE